MRAWLTPDSPAPEDERGRCFTVPNDNALVGAVSGALLPLTDASNWQSFGSMTPEEAADIMSAAFESFVGGDCSGTGGDCDPCEIPNSDGDAFTRLNPDTGRAERLGTGEQFGLWIPFWADESWPESGDNYPVVADTHAESLDPLCDAAANAVNAIHVLLDGVFDLYADEVEPAVASSETAILVGATVGALFYPPARAIIGAAEFGFSVFYDVMGHLTEDYWTDQFEQELTCILKDNATLNEDGSVTFAYTVILWEMLSTLWAAQAYVLLVAQVQYLLNIIGRDGLDAAGALDAVADPYCDCAGNWGMQWEFDTLETSEWTKLQGLWTLEDAIQVNGSWPGRYAAVTARVNIPAETKIIQVALRTFVPAGAYFQSGIIYRADPSTAFIHSGEPDDKPHGSDIAFANGSYTADLYRNVVVDIDGDGTERQITVYLQHQGAGTLRGFRIWGSGPMPFTTGTAI